MICGLTALYTVLGGLAAVVMTETIQAIVLIVGAVIITAFAYAKIGGWEHLVHSLESSNESFRLSVLRSGSIEKEFPWYCHLSRLPGAGHLVLVRRSDDRATGAGPRMRTTPGSVRCFAR